VLLARCLAPERERRFATVDNLAAFVRDNLAGGAAARPALLSRVSFRPRFTAATVALTVLVAGIAGAFGITWARRGEPAVQSIAAPAGATAKRSAPWDRVRPPQFRAQRSFGPSGCSPDMVRVADRFCIDRYEATVVDDVEQRPTSPYYPPSKDMITMVLEDWNRKLEHGTAGVPIPLPELPPWETERGWRPRAVSEPQVLPQGYASQIIAAVACAGAGKRLCTADEWRLACRGERGTKFPYGDTYRDGVCNVHRAEHEHPAHKLRVDYTDGLLDPRMNLMTSEVSGPLLHLTGASPGCASRWGDDAVYDMVGNLDEWTAGPDGAILGGFYLRQTQDGCDYTNARHTPDYFNYSLGIRCCDRLH
jgi:hypothetical protein